MCTDESYLCAQMSPLPVFGALNQNAKLPDGMAGVSQFLNKNDQKCSQYTHPCLFFFQGLLAVLTSLKIEAFVGAEAAADVLRSAGWGDQGMPMPHSQPHPALIPLLFSLVQDLEQAMNPHKVKPTT